ncbi:MAG: hypothetical protein NVS9B12_08990 [Vulcanimicrobiaceae bacterium]
MRRDLRARTLVRNSENARTVSVYSSELNAALESGRAAFTAMEAWVARPAGDPGDVPGHVLEGYAMALRSSRERMRELLSEHGTRDDIAAGLAQSEAWHRRLGLSIRDKPGFLEEEEAASE